MTDTFALRRLNAEGESILFTDARTASAFAETPLTNELLTDIWELARWAPTASNIQPLRVLYVSPETRERLLPHMAEGNRAKTAAAPAVAILAMDVQFHDLIPLLVPSRPQMKDRFADDEIREEAARFNATLQAGYFILAIRAVGLAAGPMLGFDKGGVDAEFLVDTSWRSLLVVNIGHPGPKPNYQRLPRLDPDQVIAWV
jgi:3-hydroxypropanoate dehydrogenase